MTLKKNLQELKEYFKQTHAYDLSREFVDLTDSEKIIWISTMEKDQLADTFSLLNSEDKEDLINLLKEKDIQSLIQELESDELVDTIQELPANIVKRLIANIDPKRREKINALLKYPEDSAGSIMNVDYIEVREETTIDEIIEKLKTTTLDADNLEEIWVIGPQRVLKGYIPLAEIFRTEFTKAGDMMKPITVKALATDDEEDVARLAERYFLSAVPIVDSEDRLVGSVQAEELLDILEYGHKEDLDNLQGIVTDEEDRDYLDIPPFRIAMNRVAWLVICLVTATVTSLIIERYEAVLATNIILVSFIPMLMDSGGNAGSQASTTLIQELTRETVGMEDIFKVIWKEFQIGFFTGIALVIINLIRLFIFGTLTIPVLLTISLTLMMTIIISKIIGAVLPIVAVKLNIDPTIMAGPLITTIVDTTSLIILFEVAKVFLGITM
ncbi:MAG: magnesium transporter [Helcococcus sp.]|nr:magnesium transporter [Helcococcus sp.]